MKIVHVLWGFRYGGAETMLVDIANRQCKEDEVEILLINDAIDSSLIRQIDERVTITRINRPRRSRNPFYILKLNLLIWLSRADIIHFHQDDIIRYLPVYRLRNNLCLTVHCVETKVEDIKKYNYVFAITEAVRNQITEKSHRFSKLIHNGVEVDAFTQKKEFYPKDIFRIVQVGRLDRFHKRQDLTLEALRLLIDQNHTHIRLDIIGEGTSESYLKEMGSRLKLDKYVSFLGNKSKEYIQKNLADYDLLVQPSAWEGFGLTIIEAMSACVPTLISNVDGMKTITQDKEVGFFFETGNAEDMADKMLRIMQSSPDELQRITKKAHLNIKNEFDVSCTVANYKKEYERILKEINNK
jgi:Glycosyltransferase